MTTGSPVKLAGEPDARPLAGSDTADPTRTSSEAPPRVWALYGDRAGDNAQVRALARALGWPVEEKQLAYRKLFFNRRYKVFNVLLGPSLRAVTKDARAGLRPPWPDVVVAIGRRAAAPALWIKRQSGGRTRLVHLGRPRVDLRAFDLVVTTPQYRVPRLDNVVTISLPFQAPPDLAASDVEPWRERFADLPRPWTGVLIGGSTKPFVIDAATTADFGRALDRWLAACGGAALITTSPRTGRGVAEALEGTLQAPHWLYEWQPGAPNPYAAILGLADRFIVSADSVSMLADACARGRPVAIWDVPRRYGPRGRAREALSRQAGRDTPAGRLLGALARHGLFSPRRSVTRLEETLTASGRVSWFDPEGDIPEPRAPSSLAEERQHVVERVRALLER